MRADVVLSVSLINVKNYARQGSLCQSQTEHDSSSLFLVEEKYIPRWILFLQLLQKPTAILNQRYKATMQIQGLNHLPIIAVNAVKM